MKAILITSDKCPPCETMKDEFREQLASGEIVEKKFEDDEAEVLALMQQYDAAIPSILIIADNGKVIINSSP